MLGPPSLKIDTCFGVLPLHPADRNFQLFASDTCSYFPGSGHLVPGRTLGTFLWTPFPPALVKYKRSLFFHPPFLRHPPEVNSNCLN